MSHMRFRFQDERGKWSSWYTENEIDKLTGKYILAIHIEELMPRADAIKCLEKFKS